MTVHDDRDCRQVFLFGRACLEFGGLLALSGWSVSFLVDTEHLRQFREESVQVFVLSTVSDRVERWSRPGMLLIGDAAHTMSPVGGQGLNIAIRDAIVTANHLVGPLTGSSAPITIDEAARRIEQERKRPA